jgi:hypothetical protein
MGRHALIQRGDIAHRWRRIMFKYSSIIAGTLALSLVAAAAQLAIAKDRMQQNRMSAIHECSSDAAKFPEYAWGNRDIDTYRTCMAQKGQPE